MLFSGDQPLRQILKPGVVPSLFPWTKKPSPAVIKRRERAKRREESKVRVSSRVSLHCRQSTGSVSTKVEVPVSKSALTTATAASIEGVDSVSSTLCRTKERQQVNYEVFKESKKDLHIYTGLKTSSKFSLFFSHWFLLHTDVITFRD